MRRGRWPRKPNRGAPDERRSPGWVLALAVLGHGIGHVLTMLFLFGAMRLEASVSWLLTPALGDGLVRVAASIAAAAALLAFVVAAGGIAFQAPWWRSVAIAGAAVSIGLVVAMWGGLQPSSTIWALAFDAAVLVAPPPRALARPGADRQLIERSAAGAGCRRA